MAQAHPGKTDARGGHNDNVHGGYHFHNGGGGLSVAPPVVIPQPLYRSTARTTARMEVRDRAKQEAREDTPPSPTIAAKVEAIRVLPEYEVIERAASSIGEKLKVLFKQDQPRASEVDMELIAKAEAKDSRYLAFFYLPKMDLKKPAWASVVKDGKSPVHTKVFAERAP
jgi:hypothetical protein